VVEVRALAPVVDHAVNRAGAAEGLALGDLDGAVVGGRRGLVAVLPGDPGVEQGFHKARGHPDIGVAVRRPRLQHAHTMALLGKAKGNDGGSGAAPHDHIVKCVHVPWLSSLWIECQDSPSTPWMTWAMPWKGCSSLLLGRIMRLWQNATASPVSGSAQPMEAPAPGQQIVRVPCIMATKGMTSERIQ